MESNTVGRPTDYNDQILKDSDSYLEDFSCDKWEKDKLVVCLPTIEGLATYLEISRSTLYLWEKNHDEFSDIIERLRQKQVQSLINNGLSGNYNSTIAKVLLAKHGYAEKTEIDQKTTIEDERIDLTKLTDDELRTLDFIQSKGRVSKA